MDSIYQSVKGLCKAIMNLLVAVVDLLAGILNGIACLFEKIKPHASRQFQEIRENGGLKFGTLAKKNGTERKLKKFPVGAGNKSFDEAKVQAVRKELTKKVVNRDTYDLAYSEASYNGQNRSQMALAAMLALLGIIVLLSTTKAGYWNWGALIVVLVAAGAGACVVIYSGKKIQQKNTLIRMILEQEFTEYQMVVEAAGQKAQQEEKADTVQVQTEDPCEVTEEKFKEEKSEPVTGDVKSEEQIEACVEVVKSEENMDQNPVSKSEVPSSEEMESAQKDIAAVEQEAEQVEAEPETQMKVMPDETIAEPLQENQAVNA